MKKVLIKQTVFFSTHTWTYIIYMCILQLTCTTHPTKIKITCFNRWKFQQVSILRNKKQKKNSPWRHSTTYLGLPAFSFNSFSMFLSKVSAVCEDTFGPTGIATSCGVLSDLFLEGPPLIIILLWSAPPPVGTILMNCWQLSGWSRVFFREKRKRSPKTSWVSPTISTAIVTTRITNSLQF